MKKLLTAMLSLTLLAAAALPALAASAPAAQEEAAPSGYTVEIDGRDSGARARVMVPLRAVAEKLGFAVAWDDGVVTVTGPERYAELTVGVDQYFAAPTQEGLAGASLFSLGCAPILMNDVTYVPVELFDALLGCVEGTVTLEGNTVRIHTAPASGDDVQIPSPFTDHDTLDQAAKAAGFELTVPEKVGGSPRRDVQTMGKEMIQVFYGDGEDQICIRKAPGGGDISGDYNTYAQVAAVNAGGVQVTMKGENGLVRLALWTGGGYTYSILARSGMDSAHMAALVQSVK